jgi:hypothetical protein
MFVYIWCSCILIDRIGYQLELGENIGVGDVAVAVAGAELRDDLLPDSVLPLWVHGEQEHGPDEERGRGFLPRGEEGLALVDHLVGCQRLAVVAMLLLLLLRCPRL